MTYAVTKLERWADVETSPTEEAIIAMFEDLGMGEPGFFGYKLYVTSAKRLPGAEGYAADFHNTPPYTAVDLGADTQEGKDAAADFLYRTYWNQFVEMIHTRASGTSGWYVKNYVKVSNSFYGAETNAAHINHLHVAATLNDVSDLRNTTDFKNQAAAYQLYLKTHQAEADIM